MRGTQWAATAASPSLRVLRVVATLLCAVVAFSSATASALHIFTNIRNPHLFVRPDGRDNADCGQWETPCRSVMFAAGLAAPHTRILISNGSYECGLHVTIPVSFVGVDSGVYFRCGGTKRGIWFDGVPAAVERIHFEEGYGEGAGGILVTMHTEHQYLGNYIAHCSFTSCVGVPSRLVRGAAGAVLVAYAKSRYPRPYSIDQSRFEMNYARGDTSPAGAVAVHMPVNPTETPNDKCRVFAIDRSDANDPRVSAYAGVYRIVEGVTVLGTPVYNTIGRKVTALDGEVRWVALCPSTNLFGFFTTVGIPSRSEDGCDGDISGLLHMDGIPLFETEWWLAKHSLTRAFMSLRCQDDAIAPKQCDHFYTINVPSAQNSRQSLFSIMPNMTIAGRPAFMSVDVEDPHWVWYCESGNEWIFTDSDPTEIPPGTMPDVCRRGIASATTFALHPLLVDQWKYWHNATSSWLPAQSKRVGGMQLVCVDPEELICRSVQIENANTDASVFQGALLRTAQHPRAVYTSYHTKPPQYMSYCSKYSEWMITQEDPEADPTVAEVCERSFSSLRTTAPTPEEAGRWAVFGQGGSTANWQLSTMDVNCVASCHFVTLASMIDHPCEVCGDYTSSGLRDGFRMYRQIAPSHNHVILRGRTQGWVVMPVSAMRDRMTDAYLQDSALLVGDPADDLMAVPRWKAASPGIFPGASDMIMECAATQNCTSFNVKHPVHTLFNGVYERRLFVVNRRPSYESFSPDHHRGIIYFDNVQSRWYMNHTRSPEFRLATRRTRSFTPGGATVWSVTVRRIAGTSTWSFTDSNDRAVVRCEGTEASKAAATTTSPVRPTDIFSASVYVGNVALSNAADSTPTAGALMLTYEWLPTGVAVRGLLRDVVFTGNEAIMPFKAGKLESAGALLIKNPARMMHYSSLIDVQASHNSGDWGGALSFVGMTVSLTRVVLRNNLAHNSGGAIAGRASHVNASSLTCNHNSARLHGGCADFDRLSRLYIGRSELINNSAGVSGGVVASQGYVYVHGTKVEKMVAMAFSGAVLHLVDSSLYCGVGRAVTFIGGFGCQQDADPTRPKYAARTDTDEAWWFAAANTSSQLAQAMLTLTMIVFAIQYVLTLQPAQPAHQRSSQAAKWHASQQQAQKDQSRK